MEKSMTLEEVLSLVKRLSVLEKVRLIRHITPDIERELMAMAAPSAPRKSLWGLWADLGTAPSAEEIDQARREEWASFPREDI